VAVTFTREALVAAVSGYPHRARRSFASMTLWPLVGGGEEALAKRWAYRSSTSSSTTRAHSTLRSSPRDSLPTERFLWDVSYIDDGVAIWQALLRNHGFVQAAIGTSSAFCMAEFSTRVGLGSVGV